MQRRFFLLAVATFLIAGTAFADHMVFNGESSQSNAWQGYWTSPYLATDQTSGESLTIYCLDFNHQVAPPYNWDATIRPLDPSNLALFQYGLTADAWQHYAAAASLFQDIQTLQITKPADANLLETEYQVAAWMLFVDPSHEAELESKITATGGTFATEVTDLYNLALAEGSSVLTEPNWFVVTADPAWAAENQNGVPVQEFLIHQDPPPVPEPAAILLLGTVAALLGLRMRSGRPAQFR